MMSIGQAYAIVRGRRQGDTEEAQSFLNELPPEQRAEMNRQESRARGSKRPKKAYKLGERLQVRNG